MMTDSVKPATVLVAVGIAVLFVTWFLPWGQIESDSSVSSPGQDGAFWSFPGFTFQFNIDFDFSFWWYNLQFNGERDSGSWFNDELEGGGEMIASNIMAILGLFALLIYGLLSPSMRQQPATTEEGEVDARVVAGWAFVVLMPLAMLLWTVGVGNDDGLRHTAAFFFAWIATITASFGLAWTLLMDQESTGEDGDETPETAAKS